MVERVQVEVTTQASRWWAVAASGYATAAGLYMGLADRAAGELGWLFGVGVVALTVIPHLFRHYTGFAVACWSAAILIQFGGLIVYSIGVFLWLPAQALLVLAALVPPTQQAVRRDTAW